MSTYKYEQKRKLFREAMSGCIWIGGKKDARYTAGILRLLADELDPQKKGDPRAAKYMTVLKDLIGYNP